ncbi:hypothetical protein [Methylobacterium sp. 17Sr1-1]|uniref:hypothetical protein n=1 Tax=Methylobacterium sp. 17Sr1-1 TaxID=2202826 RepID=UPI00194F3828|nr:hypothetical protein [Methylobacterium sp. 17Sr1-1]
MSHDLRDIALAALSLQVTMLRLLTEKGIIDQQDLSNIARQAGQDVGALPNAKEVQAVIKDIMGV